LGRETGTSEAKNATACPEAGFITGQTLVVDGGANAAGVANRLISTNRHKNCIFLESILSVRSNMIEPNNASK
jgi:hypothetical protein